MVYPDIKIFHKFVVLDISNNYHDATNTTIKAETKSQGRRRVASTPVLSRRRFGVSSSDLPSFINLNHLPMLDTNGRNKLPFTDGSWAVAELQVSYEPKNNTGVILQSSYQCYQVFSSMWDRSLINLQEQFCVLFLNQKYEVIGFRIINTGKTSSTTVDVSFIAVCALVCRARGVVIAHNHPSGRLRPSQKDMDLTRLIIDRLMLFEITVVDHIIMTHSGYFSFADSDLIIKNE